MLYLRNKKHFSKYTKRNDRKVSPNDTRMKLEKFVIEEHDGTLVFLLLG